MLSMTVLFGIYADRMYRISIHPEERADFPGPDYVDSSVRFEKIAIHRDSQGMLRGRRKSMRFLYDPPTGAISLLSGKSEVLSGNVQTGRFNPAGLSVRLEANDTIYGFGAATGRPTRNDQSFRLLNLDTLFYSIPGASYSTFPFFIIRRASGVCTGVFVAFAGPGRVRTLNAPSDPEGPAVRMTPEDETQPVGFDFFVFEGTLPEILNRYTELTGRPFLPPAWALGFHQSRWSYRSEQEVLALAQRFRAEDVPCDAIHLDIHYMDGYKVFTWDPAKFADPAGMHKQLGELGVRTVAIVDPGVAVQDNYAVYQAGLKHDAYCKTTAGVPFVGKVWPGRTTFPDFTRADVRDWWAREHEPLFRAGVSGIWNDMNDPTLWMGKRYDPLQEDVLHADGPHSEFRNLYANLEAQAANEAFRKHSKLRPFVLTRSAFAGIQKYAAVWTGDNHSSWAHLRENLNMVLNLGLSGVSLSGADVGGFAGGHPFNGVLKVIKLLKNRELFTRWVELGSLMPFFRAHTTLYSYAQEPWSFGEEALAIARKHIRRRYRLLPYIYNLAWESHLTGAPMVRPVFYEFPEFQSAELHTQFMLGPDLLAAPVLEKGATSRRVDLPPGDWYEFESGRKYAGGAQYTLDVSPGYFPLFVRAGTILPCSAGGKNAEEALLSGLILELYPAKTMRGRVRLDDLTSPGAMAGDFYDLQLSGEQERSGNIQLKFATLKKKYVPPFSTITVRLPSTYRVMQFKGKSLDGAATDLMREDRVQSVYSFELPLNAAEAEFEYRATWSL